MEVMKRVHFYRILEKIEKNKVYAEKIGTRNRSMMKVSKEINERSSNGER